MKQFIPFMKLKIAVNAVTAVNRLATNTRFTSPGYDNTSVKQTLKQKIFYPAFVTVKAKEAIKKMPYDISNDPEPKNESSLCRLGYSPFTVLFVETIHKLSQPSYKPKAGSRNLKKSISNPDTTKNSRYYQSTLTTYTTSFSRFHAD